MEEKIKVFLLDRLAAKMDMFGLQKSEMNSSFNLVQSGLLDSMSFVDLVSELEQFLSVEIDFDVALDDPSFTTIGGIIKYFDK